jgi:hypothetical protein
VFRIGVGKVDRDVAKVDQDVAHVAITMHVCFKCMFQIFHLYHTYVASVFIWILRIHACASVFHLDTAYVYNGFQVFLQVFQKHVSSVASVLFCMLQLLHMYVSKVNRMLHMRCVWEAAAVQATSRATQVTSEAVQAHCWGALSQA